MWDQGYYKNKYEGHMSQFSPTHQTHTQSEKSFPLPSHTAQAHAHLLKGMPFYRKVLKRQEVSHQEQYCKDRCTQCLVVVGQCYIIWATVPNAPQQYR